MSKILSVELVEINVDLNSNTNPTATFKLVYSGCQSKCLVRKIQVKYRAFVLNQINIRCKKLKVRVGPDCTFTFPIPDFTTGLEVTVIVGNSLCSKSESVAKLIEFVPSNCKPDFVADMIPTRLMFKWCNKIAIDTSGLDHKKVEIGELRIFGHQLGPCRASRAMGIVHIGMFEAFNQIHPTTLSYLGLGSASGSAAAAIAQAMFDTLINLFPSHQPRLQILLNDLLNQIPNSSAKTNGIAIGHTAAAAIILLRQSDGSAHPEPIIGVDYFPSDAPGEWRSDPITGNLVALGAKWPLVTPFVINTADQFRSVPPPALGSVEYAMAFDEVKSIGGNGTTTPTVRSAYQTETGIFWAYDGTPSLCAPPRLYNQICTLILLSAGVPTADFIRIITKINVGMADAGIAAWDSKYFYKFWRPVSAIREADVGTGPSGLGDGNAATVGDVNFVPLGAPASNVPVGVNFTPPFPGGSVSGHATFGGCIFQLLRNYLGTDNVPFTFVSDELNGITVDNAGNPRPYEPRTYQKLSEAEEENGQSRIYLGIHFNPDKVLGIKMGRDVADYVNANLYVPL